MVLLLLTFCLLLLPLWESVINCFMFCCTLLYVHSRIAIILIGKRELIALSLWCLVMVWRLFLAVPRGCLQFVIVVFPDHTHLLFLNTMEKNPILKMTDPRLSISTFDIQQQHRLLSLFFFFFFFFFAGPRSAVGNVSSYRCVSDCRSRGREFDPGPVPHFRGD